MKRALFFDRDGTLIEDVGYLRRLEDLRLLPGAAAAVRLARASGFQAVLVTNQSGVARGFFDEELVMAANQRLSQACGGFDAIHYCPHHPSEGQPPWRADCDCRKPRPGMLLRARDGLGLDLAQSVVIGDSLADLGAARAAGCRAVLVRTGQGADGEERARAGGMAWDHAAPGVLEAVRWAVAELAAAAPEPGAGRARGTSR